MKDLTQGSPTRLILAFTGPLILVNVFQQLYQLVNTVIVGRMLGADALAAVGCTGSLLFFVMGFAWGMTGGFAIPTAQRFGARDFDGVRRSVAAGVILTAAVALAMTALTLPTCHAVLRLLRTPPELLADAGRYITVAFATIVISMLSSMVVFLIRSLGDSRTPLIVNSIAFVANIGLDVLFIGPLRTGVIGAAFATAICQGASGAMCVWYISRRMPLLRPRREDWLLLLHPRPDQRATARAELGAHLRIGLPMGLQSSIVAIGSIVLQWAINGLGATSVAAYTAAQRIDNLAMSPSSCFGMAAATFTAQNWGARQYARIRRGVSSCLAMTLGVAVVMGTVNILLGGRMVAIFVGAQETEVVTEAGTYLAVVGVFYLALAVLFPLRNVLQGLGRTLVPTLSGFMELISRVVCAVIFVAAFGFLGVSLASAAAWVTATIPLVVAYLGQRRRLLALEAEASLPPRGTRGGRVGPVAATADGGGSGGADALVADGGGSAPPVPVATQGAAAGGVPVAADGAAAETALLVADGVAAGGDGGEDREPVATEASTRAACSRAEPRPAGPCDTPALRPGARASSPPPTPGPKRVPSSPPARSRRPRRPVDRP